MHLHIRNRFVLIEEVVKKNAPCILYNFLMHRKLYFCNNGTVFMATVIYSLRVCTAKIILSIKSEIVKISVSDEWF